MSAPDEREWLEADGLGGFASGTVSGPRTRRYHALLLSAARPPVERFVLVNGMDVTVEVDGREIPVSVQDYGAGVRVPEGPGRLAAFEARPWPRWTFEIDESRRLHHELFAVNGRPVTAMRWRLEGDAEGVRLRVRPFLSGRDYHALHFENGAFRFDAESGADGSLAFRPYEGVPGIRLRHDGEFRPEPLWYRGFHYAAEAARGFDAREDCAAPGRIEWDLSGGEAVLLLEAVPGDSPESAADSDAAAPSLRERFRRLAAREKRRRAAFPTALEQAADAYVVRRGSGKTIVAGYPWFTDWGRDTFLAMRGLLLATGRLREAAAILVEWSGAVSLGMVPNRFADRGEEPEFNSVDASLWFVVVAGELLELAGRRGVDLGRASVVLRRAMDAVLDGYSAGTRFGIRADEDGLLRAGVPGQQLTWMDARVGDHVVTPRIGKPVEIQALWINALEMAARHDPRRGDVARRARASFARRFPDRDGGGLVDVVDADHVPGRDDASVRPNQILAVGGLPFPLLTGKAARRVVDLVEDHLLTPVGLRTLSPEDPEYRGRYRGGPAERDAAYHQGTAWPWLLGPFVEAWLRTRPASPRTLAEARTRFLEPLLRHVDEAGIGHVSEIADGDAPHVPGGCPFQAWSVGEALRIAAMLAPPEEPSPAPRRKRPRREAAS